VTSFLTINLNAETGGQLGTNVNHFFFAKASFSTTQFPKPAPNGCPKSKNQKSQLYLQNFRESKLDHGSNYLSRLQNFLFIVKVQERVDVSKSKRFATDLYYNFY
jgi:hypothetical protein